MKQEPLLLR